MESKTDIEILDSILKGRTDMYAILVDRYKNMAFTIAYRVSGVHEDAEEIVQDAFLKVYYNLGSFRKESRFSTWLYRIVYNTAISQKRLKRPVGRPIEEVSATASEEPYQDSVFDEEFRLKLIERVMSCLTEEDRIIVTLFYLNESDIEDIRAVTGLSRSNIKVRLFRARKKIQDAMAGYSQLALI